MLVLKGNIAKLFIVLRPCVGAIDEPPGGAHIVHFKNRTEAGRVLAERLVGYRSRPGVVYPLARGGVVLGVEIAQALALPLDLIIPRKIGHPSNPEYAIGAVTETGEVVMNEDAIEHVDRPWLERQVVAERAEARRRHELYLRDRPAVSVAGATAILVDDGIATGLTMLAAIRDVRARRPARIVVAIPVTPEDTAERLAREVDELVALDIPEFYLGAVSAYYDDFPQVSDEEVIALLKRGFVAPPPG